MASGASGFCRLLYLRVVTIAENNFNSGYGVRYSKLPWRLVRGKLCPLLHQFSLRDLPAYLQLTKHLSQC